MHHNFCKWVLILLVNMNNFIRSLDIIYHPFKYLTNDTIFRDFFIPGGFLYLYFKIWSVTWIRNIFPRKIIDIVILKTRSVACSIICVLCDLNFYSITKLRIHMYHTITLKGLTKQLFSINCMHFSTHDCPAKIFYKLGRPYYKLTYKSIALID